MDGYPDSRRSLHTETAGRKVRLPFFHLFLLCLLFVAGCGEEEGSPPVLTGFQPSNIRYVVGFNGGEVPLSGLVRFEDPDGDLVLLSVTWGDCGREPVERLDIVQNDRQRTKSGTIPLVIMISTNCPTGEYTVRLTATDGRGLTSDALGVPYEIY